MIVDPELLGRLVARAEAGRWDVPPAELRKAIEASLRRAFEGREASAAEIERYLDSLHVADLALACACACARAHEGAWDYFVREHRPILYRAADAIDSTGAARELADGLYADLYGLRAVDGERRSLFTSFHGRSSLATWLRAILAQRYVDMLRLGRRVAPMPDGEDASPAAPAASPDPDRARLVRLVYGALRTAIARLPIADRFRLRSYYAAGLTLAQIGRLAGAHEATVSRKLSRTRRQLRAAVERQLREDAGLSDSQIERCFELAVEVDAGSGLDMSQLFGVTPDRKHGRPDRST